MQTLLTLYHYLAAHPYALAVALYLLANVAKRIPEPKPGWRHTLWAAFEFCMILPWDRWFGLPKTITWQPGTQALDVIPAPPRVPIIRDTDPMPKD